MIWLTFFASIGLNVTFAAILIIKGLIGVAIIFIIISAIFTFMLYTSRHVIPLSALVLETVCNVIHKLVINSLQTINAPNRCLDIQVQFRFRLLHWWFIMVI